MKLSFSIFWCTVLVFFGGLSTAFADDVDTFGRLPFVKDVQISPDGKKMAYLQSSKGQYLLVVRQLDGSGKPKVLNIPERSLYELEWLSDDRIFVTMYTSKYIKIERERHTFWRAGIYDVSKNKMIWPFKGSNFNFNLNAPYLLNKLASQPHHVLLSYYFNNHVGVFKLDIRDGSWDIIESQSSARSWKTDWNGEVRIVFKYNTQEDIYQAQHRFNNNQGFTPLWLLKAGKRIPFSATNVNFDKDNKHIYYRTRLRNEENETEQAANSAASSAGSQSLSTAASAVENSPAKISERQLEVVWRGEINNNNEVVNVKRVFALDEHDAGWFTYDYQTRLVNGVSYVKHFRSAQYFDRSTRQIYADLQATFPNASISFTSSDTQKQKWIAEVSGADYGIQYFYYDIQAASIALLASAYPDYNPAQGGKVAPIAYQTADGLTINAYLTTPPGYQKGTKVPVLVFPHGGPEARDDMGFDWQRQFFASRGYAVLQPNFRGSSGYGKSFSKAGYGEWGRKMQTDLSDGLQYLIEQGIVDPKRACIVGSSYGGYAALIGAVLTPNTYQCAVSFAGVTFLEGMFHHSVKQKYGFSYWEKSIGVRFNQEELRQYSPLYAVSSHSSPMLVMHGRHDTIVPPYHAERLRKVFKKKSLRKSKVIMVDDATHWFTHQSTREEFLEQSMKFIDKHIGD